MAQIMKQLKAFYTFFAPVERGSASRNEDMRSAEANDGEDFTYTTTRCLSSYYSIFVARLAIMVGKLFMDRRMLAAKFMDKKEAEGRNKEGRSKTKREIEMLDHPFLPKLKGIMENERWLCLLTEFCEGGDMHVLRQRQVGKRFSENAVRVLVLEFTLSIDQNG